jgi:putative drug exporter of the RND superfamily
MNRAAYGDSQRGAPERPVGPFAAIARASVRRRWMVVAGWVAAVVVSTALLPSISSVTKNDNAAFLPATAPSVRAANLDSPFQSTKRGTAVLVAVADAALTPSDQAFVDGVEAAVRRAPSVRSVRDESLSADGRARIALVQFGLDAFNGGPAAARSVDAIRRVFAARTVAGVSMYLTGTLPVVVDQQRAANDTERLTQILSIALILILLFLVFRSLLAPLVTLLPAGLALALAQPVIAESTRIGVQISSLLQVILVVLVLGAGTDYGLFLIFRYRESLRRGMSPEDAIVFSLSRVGESVTFSAATVIAALLSLLLASFGLYRGVGPGLAIGVGIVLVVELTLLPALLALLGKAVFWPSIPTPGLETEGLWGRIAARVCRAPVRTLVGGVVMLGVMALSLVAYRPSGFDTGGAIPNSGSSRGEQVLLTHFSAAEVNPTIVVFRLRRSAWFEPGVLDSAADALWASGHFDDLLGALDPNGTRLAPDDISFAYRRLGPPEDLSPVPPSRSRVRPGLYDAYRATEQFVSSDGLTVRFLVSLRAGSPSSTRALQAIPAVRSSVDGVAAEIGAVKGGVAGQAPAAADVADISRSDVVSVIPVVLVVLALLLAAVLRSMVAPLYLVVSVGLSYVAALGLSTLIFVVVGGQLGINFTLPFLMFIFIMALGEDYNILVMSRIREEASVLPLAPAVYRAISSTGTTVTSAGLVLAGTFGVLALTAEGQVRQIGTGLALGILLDTFVVRTLLVPSTAVLLGRWNWWPSALSRRQAPAQEPPRVEVGSR